jgi:hypothetical protein
MNLLTIGHLHSFEIQPITPSRAEPSPGAGEAGSDHATGCPNAPSLHRYGSIRIPECRRLK